MRDVRIVREKISVVPSLPERNRHSSGDNTTAVQGSVAPVFAYTYTVEGSNIKYLTCYHCPGTTRVIYRGTTADIGDNVPPSLTILGCSLTAVELAGPLFDVILPSFHLPSPLLCFGTVPCKIFLQRARDLTARPNLSSRLIRYTYS